MAKGFEANQERKWALQALGKDLTRRAKSRCELTHAAGVPLTIYEIPPAPPEPDLEHCLLLSASAVEQLEHPATLRQEEWRHLSDLIWTDNPAVQVMCVRILRHLASTQPWAQRLLEEAFLEPEVEHWADAGSL